MRWTGHVAHLGEMRSVYKILARKHEGKRPCGSPRHRWKDNIRTVLRKGGHGLDFIWLLVKD
jgi:hypothetical protein